MASTQTTSAAPRFDLSGMCPVYTPIEPPHPRVLGNRCNSSAEEWRSYSAAKTYKNGYRNISVNITPRIGRVLESVLIIN